MSHLGGKSDNRINNFTNSQINLKSIINRLMLALGVGLLPIVQQTHQIFQSCVFKLNHCERQLLHLYTNCEDQVLQTRLRILVIKPPVSKTSRNKTILHVVLAVSSTTAVPGSGTALTKQKTEQVVHAASPCPRHLGVIVGIVWSQSLSSILKSQVRDCKKDEANVFSPGSLTVMPDPLTLTEQPKPGSRHSPAHSAAAVFPEHF